MATRSEVTNSEIIKANAQDTLEAKAKIAAMEKKGQGRREDIIDLEKDYVKFLSEEKKYESEKTKNLKEIRGEYSEIGDKAKAIGDKVDTFINSLPGGNFLAKSLGVDELGKKMEDEVIGRIQESYMGTQDLGKGFKMAFGPVGIALAVLTAVVGAIIAARSAARDLGKEIGVSTSEAAKMLPALKASQFQFKMMGLDGAKLETTLGEIGKEFGSLENMTVANARNIERFAQNSGIAGSEVVKLNKVFMDLDGLSFDAATNVSRVAADLAKAAGVSTTKVIGDMSSAAEKFAEFSQDGAAGMAKAAVEAAKVGASLGTMLGAMDNMLDFESSITAQFEAQVLTGKMINTERARQLSLEGDIAGFQAEVQSIIGSVGDIQSMNVIERRSIAKAIGISVQDLLKISRGEQVQQQETVQDKLDTTNAILSKQYGIQIETLEGVKDKNFNFNQGAY